MKRILIFLPIIILNALDEMIKRVNVTRSEMVRRAVEEYLKNEGKI